MSDLVLPHTLVPGTPENVQDVQDNFEAVRAKVNGAISLDNLAAEIQQLLVPTTTVAAMARATAPNAGWLLCDGGSYPRANYPALASALGTTYGGDATNFNVPDLRARVPVGADGAAARMAANDALGNVGGEVAHVTTVAEMPSHTHPPGAQNAFAVQRSGDAANWPGGFDLPFAEFTAATTGATGGGAAHNNMQPYQVVNYFIKT